MGKILMSSRENFLALQLLEDFIQMNMRISLKIRWENFNRNSSRTIDFIESVKEEKYTRVF